MNRYNCTYNRMHLSQMSRQYYKEETMPYRYRIVPLFPFTYTSQIAFLETITSLINFKTSRYLFQRQSIIQHHVTNYLPGTSRFPHVTLYVQTLKTMYIYSITGKWAGVHIRLCFSRVRSDSLRWCRLWSGQAPKPTKKTSKNSPRSDTKKERW